MTTNLTDGDIKKIAAEVALKIEEDRQSAPWIVDAQQHYDDHQAMRRFLAQYNDTKSWIIKVILTMATLGVLSVVAIKEKVFG